MGYEKNNTQKNPHKFILQIYKFLTEEEKR